MIHNPAEHVDPSLVGGMVVEIEDGGVRCPGSLCPLGSLFARFCGAVARLGRNVGKESLLFGEFLRTRLLPRDSFRGRLILP